MKLSIYVVFALLVMSCSESSKPISPVLPPVADHLFDISVGKEWRLINKGSSILIRVIGKDTVPWVMDYWNTDDQIVINSYLLEFKEFDNSLPRYYDYAILETDSGYIFGTKNHSLVEPNYPTDNFVKLFFIPNTPVTGQTESDEYTKNILGNEYYWNYSALWTSMSEVVVNDSLRKVWKVEYYSEQKTPVVSKMGIDFEILENIGFYKYKNFVLDSIP